MPVPVGRTAAPGLHGTLVRQWAFYMALTVLVLAWLGLVGLARTLPGGRRIRVAAVWVIGALWAIPLLAAPPLQSRDAYSYVAQGEMASHRIDPSRRAQRGVPSIAADGRREGPTRHRARPRRPAAGRLPRPRRAALTAHTEGNR